MNTFRLAKLGKNAITSTDPSDFIFAPDWNTPKIIKEATATPELGVAAVETFYNMAHGLNYTPFVFGFIRFSDNRVGAIGCKHAGEEFYSTNLKVNATNVIFGYNNLTDSGYQPAFKYIATEIPLAGTPSVADTGGRRIVIAKSGYNALTETNPNNKIYDSQFGTLKYFDEDITEITIPTATPDADVTVVDETVLVTHNLGYHPFFGANFEYSGDDPGKVFIMPIMAADAGYWMYDMIYATTTQLIYRREFGNTFGGGTYAAQTIKVYWKIYSKSLELDLAI